MSERERGFTPGRRQVLRALTRGSGLLVAAMIAPVRWLAPTAAHAQSAEATPQGVPTSSTPPPTSSTPPPTSSTPPPTSSTPPPTTTTTTTTTTSTTPIPVELMSFSIE